MTQRAVSDRPWLPRNFDLVTAAQDGNVSLMKMTEQQLSPAVGPGEHDSPRHRVPFKSRDEGSKCVSRRGEQYPPTS